MIDIHDYIKQFVNVKRTRNYTYYIGSFWSPKQRNRLRLHEISYRACFKPNLPEFFINMLSKEQDIIYDPFAGRGTTLLTAALLNRRVISNDINPLSSIYLKPRLNIVEIKDIEHRLNYIPLNTGESSKIDLSMFFHEKTLKEIVSLKEYLKYKKETNTIDPIDEWIQMVATIRLHGHSSGFFSVYTLPPNLTTTPKNQININNKRNQTPEYRNIKELILRKSKRLHRGLLSRHKLKLYNAYTTGLFLEKNASETPEIADNSIQFTVTSPPFLNVVNYIQDNWLKLWFNSIDKEELKKELIMTSSIDIWSKAMLSVLKELYRVTQPQHYVAFEVGEVSNQHIKLEEYIIPLAIEAGFSCECVIINKHKFTKTANIWKIYNNENGTNTNRIVILRK